MFKCIKNWFTDRFTDPVVEKKQPRFRIQYRPLKYYNTRFAWHLDMWQEARRDRSGALQLAHYEEIETNVSKQELIDKVDKIMFDEKMTEYYG